MALVTLLPACILGFLLPGWGLATLAGAPARACAAFLLSLLVLFEAVLLLQIADVPIAAGTVAPHLAAAAAGALLVAAWRRGWRALLPDVRGTHQALAATLAEPGGRILAACVGLVGLTFALRYGVQPLSGVDTSWRWDFLARQLLANQTLDFYPPLSPADYRQYFFPDAIPPLVSVAYWWLYATYGRVVPELTAVPVVAQWGCATALAYHVGTRLASRRAGMLAAAILASSPLFYRATFIGQDTGLTAAALGGVLLWASGWSDRTRWSAPLLAGAAAGVAALTREYGCAWTLLGVLTLAWRGAGLVPMLALAATALAVAGPWYLRTWLLTGNPFYPLHVGPFDSVALNPLYAATLDFQREYWIRFPRSLADHAGYVLFVLSLAPIAIPAGVAALMRSFRRDWLLAVAAGLLAVLWLQSIAYTQGGFRHATRVLSPTILVLSIAAAIGIARAERPWLSRTAVAAICLATLWTLRIALVFPSELEEVAWRDIPKVATERTIFVFQLREQQTLATVRAHLPPGSRILSDNNYSSVALRGSGYELVPLWSPEFAFVFDKSLSAEDIDRRVRALGVQGLLIGLANPLTQLYVRYPFFESPTLPWQPVARLESGYALFAPTDAAR